MKMKELFILDFKFKNYAVLYNYILTKSSG